MLPFLRLRSVMWMTTLTSCMRSGRGWTISKANSCAHGTWLESFVWCLTRLTMKTPFLEDSWMLELTVIDSGSCGFCGGWDGDEGPGCTEAPARLHWGHMAGKKKAESIFPTRKLLCKCANVLVFRLRYEINRAGPAGRSCCSCCSWVPPVCLFFVPFRLSFLCFGSLVCLSF